MLTSSKQLKPLEVLTPRMIQGRRHQQAPGHMEPQGAALAHAGWHMVVRKRAKVARQERGQMPLALESLRPGIQCLKSGRWGARILCRHVAPGPHVGGHALRQRILTRRWDPAPSQVHDRCLLEQNLLPGSFVAANTD
jgi:hypothetical protein